MGFEILAGPDGRGLVRDGERRFVVPPALAARLREPDGAAYWWGLVGGAPGAGARSPLLRLTLLPARLVRAWSQRLAWLASTPALVGLVVLGAVGAVSAPAPRLTAGPDAWCALGLVMIGGLWHELGHAAALRREGWSPGAIGVGLLRVLPVLWSDVSATALLDRGGKVRVDLAGLAFQLGLAGVLACAAAPSGWAPAGVAMRAALLMAVWSLLPFVRSDGHWLACDLLDLPALEAPCPPRLGRGWRGVLAAWRLLTVLILGSLPVLLGWRVWLMREHLEAPAATLLAVLAIAVAALTIPRSVRRMTRLLGAVWRDRRPRP